MRFRLTPQSIEIVRSKLTEHSNVFPVLQRAAECPELGLDLEVTKGATALWDSMAADVNLVQYAITALKCHALLLLVDSRAEEALADAMTMLRLSRLCEAAPTIVGYYATARCRYHAIDVAGLALQTGPVPVQAHERLEGELTSVDPIKRYQSALASERAVGREEFREVYKKAGSNWYRQPFLSWTRNKDYSAYVNQFDEPMRLVERPYPEIADRIATLDRAGSADPCPNSCEFLCNPPCGACTRKWPSFDRCACSTPWINVNKWATRLSPNSMLLAYQERQPSIPIPANH